MAVVITGIKDLNKLFEQRMSLALKQTQKIVGDCIQESINEYYKERVFRDGKSNIPVIYERTYRLLNSLIKTDVVYSGNVISCEVKISDDYLNYKYPGTDGWNGVSATGRDVLEWNEADGSHGGTVDGDWKIWTQAMNTLGGDAGIMAIFTDKLRKCGIPIK